MIYLDNAATTEVDKDTIDIFNRYLTDKYYNPSALYKPAVNVALNIKSARESIAKILNVSSDEILFISSGTEGDNAALFNTRTKAGSKIIISAMEHSAVYNSAMELRQRGYIVKIAPVDRFGRIIEEEYIKLIDDNTSLISIIHVSNETGTVNDIEKLSEIAKKINKNIIFHSDGVQAFTKVAIKLKHTNIDLYTFSGHKIGAPKGIAGLYVRKGINIKPLLYGGGQEKNLRSSTENVAGIISFNYMANKSILNYAENYSTMTKLLQNMANYITLNIPNVIINTDFDNCSSNILSIAFGHIRGEVLMHSLEKHGIYIGIGSACSSKKGIKRIPNALNLPTDYHDGMIRISITPNTTEKELVYVADIIIKEYNQLIKFIRI